MSYSEVNELRKNGFIDQAYVMAVTALQANPKVKQMQQALVWVMVEKLRIAAENTDWNTFDADIEELSHVDFEEIKSKLFLQLSLLIGKRIDGMEFDDPQVLTRYYQFIKQFDIVTDQSCSNLLLMFTKHRKGWKQYTEFVDWYNIEHLTELDFEQHRLNNRYIMSLAEQVYANYAACAIEANDVERMEKVLPQIKQLGIDYPHYTTPLHYQCQLLLALKRKEEAYQVIKNSIAKKSHEYWMWQLLGDATEDTDLRIACYCKALSCSMQPENMIAIKQQLANMLVDSQQYNEARTEVDELIAIRKQNGMRIPADVKAMTKADWYLNAEKYENNNTLYTVNYEKADAIVNDQFEFIDVIVTTNREDKKTLEFVDIDGKRGSCFTRHLNANGIKTGDLVTLKVRSRDENLYDVDSVTLKEDRSLWRNNIKHIEGKIGINEERLFGLVRDNENRYFVPNYLLRNIENGDYVQCTVVKMYDTKMDIMGWMVIRIDSNRGVTTAIGTGKPRKDSIFKGVKKFEKDPNAERISANNNDNKPTRGGRKRTHNSARGDRNGKSDFKGGNPGFKRNQTDSKPGKSGFGRDKTDFKGGKTGFKRDRTDSKPGKSGFGRDKSDFKGGKPGFKRDRTDSKPGKSGFKRDKSGAKRHDRGTSKAPKRY